MKKTVAILLSLCLSLCALAALTPASAAEPPTECVVAGADLSEAELAAVYQGFGLTRGAVTELRLTNAEERSLLAGLVDESVVGTRALSCVYIRQQEPGTGLDVAAENVTWCTTEMYRAALETAGVADVRVRVTAPCQVSGTAALAGIYKAYESLTGETLDEQVKVVGAQELVTTAELAEVFGQLEAPEIVAELKTLLAETQNMTDEELRGEIDRLCQEYGVKLNDSQTQQLMDLCRRLEGLSDSELVKTVEDLQGTVKKIGETRDKLEEARETISGFLEDAQDFFQQVRDYLSGLLGGRAA